MAGVFSWEIIRLSYKWPFSYRSLTRIIYFLIITYQTTTETLFNTSFYPDLALPVTIFQLSGSVRSSWIYSLSFSPFRYLLTFGGFFLPVFTTYEFETSRMWPYFIQRNLRSALPPCSYSSIFTL